MARRAPKRVAIGIDLQWPLKHHVDVAGGILRYAEEHGWECEVIPALESGRPVRLSRRRYDGIVARATLPLVAAARRMRIPAVNVWTGSPDLTLPRVTADADAASRMAADHLLGLGFRRFGFLGYARDRASTLEGQTFRDALAESGFPLTTCSVPVLDRIGSSWPRYDRLIDAWMRTWKLPIAIHVSADLIARYLADAVVHRGFRVPDDVAIVSCGNNELLCNRLTPTLTAIEFGFERVGYNAARLLDALMKGRKPRVTSIRVPPAELVPRRSTEIFAVEDELVSQALRFITDNVRRSINVGDVVSALPVTRRSLERRFRSTLGRTIHDEIARARIQKAKRQLVETDAPLKVVARDAGFSGIEQLSAAFRRIEGIAPGAYRRRQRTP